MAQTSIYQLFGRKVMLRRNPAGSVRTQMGRAYKKATPEKGGQNRSVVYGEWSVMRIGIMV